VSINHCKHSFSTDLQHICPFTGRVQSDNRRIKKTAARCDSHKDIDVIVFIPFTIKAI